MSSARSVRRIDGPIEATVRVPGSKSIANRALICAALASGQSRLTNVPDGDDSTAMVACLQRLGVSTTVDAGSVSIVGVDGQIDGAGVLLDAALAGTTSRFLIGLAALGRDPITIDGLPPLRRRPFAPLFDALAQLGVSIERGTNEELPVTVHGPPTSGLASVPGDVSSQFVTSLMLIGPYVLGGLELSLTSPLISRPYIDLTASVMSWFGSNEIEIVEDRISIAPGGYAGTDVFVEPDASSASYPLALAAVVGGSVTVEGLGDRAIQGDACFADILGRMGCAIDRDRSGVTVVREPNRELVGIDIDMSDISDLVPTLAVVAAFATSATRIRGVGFIRGKESDRIGDLVHELRSAGVAASELADGIEIRPSVDSMRSATMQTHHDHRLAMAFAVLGSASAGISVEDPGVVSKSWPGFWSDLDDIC